MATLTLQYVTFGASGAHTRQPRATTSYGGFNPIPGLNPGGTATLAPGTPYQAGPAPQTLPFGAQTLTFAFANVSGCTEGGLTSFVAGTPPPVGTVGADPIRVLYVYLPTGGGPGSSTGAVIDAFNETTGALVDNDFVTVTPDSGGTLTAEANTDGWVDTTKSGCTIAADHPNIGPYQSLPTNVYFDQWVDLGNPTPPPALVNGANLTPNQGVTVYALAFYKNPAPGKPIVVKEYVKEHIKEFVKEHIKEGYLEHPKIVYESQKPLAEFQPKYSKDSVEGQGFGNIGDPVMEHMQQLDQRVTQLEAQRGPGASAFIKPQDRPVVGNPQNKEPGST